jgi:hypothetical protein
VVAAESSLLIGLATFFGDGEGCLSVVGGDEALQFLEPGPNDLSNLHRIFT